MFWDFINQKLTLSRFVHSTNISWYKCKYSMFLHDDNNLFNKVWKGAKNYSYAIAMMIHII